MGQNYPACLFEKLTKVTIPADPSQTGPGHTITCIKFLTNNIHPVMAACLYPPRTRLVVTVEICCFKNFIQSAVTQLLKRKLLKITH